MTSEETAEGSAVQVSGTGQAGATASVPHAPEATSPSLAPGARAAASASSSVPKAYSRPMARADPWWRTGKVHGLPLVRHPLPGHGHHRAAARRQKKWKSWRSWPSWPSRARCRPEVTCDRAADAGQPRLGAGRAGGRLSLFRRLSHHPLLRDRRDHVPRTAQDWAASSSRWRTRSPASRPSSAPRWAA